MGQYVLSCAEVPIEGSCPVGAQQWVQAATLDPFALPSPEVLAAAFQAGMTAFFVPTMAAMLAALTVKWVLNEIR